MTYRRATLLIALALAGCAEAAVVTSAPSTTTTTAPPRSFLDLGSSVEIPPVPDLDPASVAAGQVLYEANCAACHGFDLAGDPNWMIPNEDGSYLPPPHDATGHTWHHSDQLLVDIVRNGSDFPQSRMPPFGALLSESDVLAILDYFKSTWGPLEREVQWGATVREPAKQGD